MDTKNSNLSSPDDPRPFSCESCGRQFSTSAYLSQHRRIHSGIKPYACRFCDRKFTQLSHVQQHERIHTGEKPYSCFTCLKSFTQMSNLHSHQRQHMKNKPCKCSHCFMAFDSQQDLENHIDSKHSSIKYNKVLICSVCSKMYNSETYLKKHIERHEDSSCHSIDSGAPHKHAATCEQQPLVKYRRQGKSCPMANGDSLPSSQPLASSVPPVNDRPKQELIDHEAAPPNHQMRPGAFPNKDSRFSENVSMALDISKSIATAASGLSLNVILENLASNNCPSPLVSVAANVWGHSLLPSNNTHRKINSNPAGISDNNNGISREFDLSVIGSAGILSKPSLKGVRQHHSRSASSPPPVPGHPQHHHYHHMPQPPPPPPPQQQSHHSISAIASSSHPSFKSEPMSSSHLDRAGSPPLSLTAPPHINIPTTAFSLH